MDFSFDSSETILAIAQSEYQNEHNRTSIIDSKLAITLPIVATYFFLAVQVSSLRKLMAVPLDTQSTSNAMLGIMIPLSYILALCTAIIALILMICAVATRSYQTVDPKCFNTGEQMSREKKELSAVLVTVYIRAIDLNRLQNDIRAREYKWGWISSAISFGFFAIHVIIKN